MTLPTQLTLLRMGLAALVMALLYVPGWPAKAVALVGFLLASLTDWLDGFLARRWNQTSPLGALLDPIADKVLVLGSFLVFVQLRLVPAWMVFLIVLRESLITGVRLFAASRHIVLSAAREGKQKTVSQMMTIGVILAALTLREHPGVWLPREAEEAIDALIALCLWLTTALTVVSGTAFFWRHRSVLRETLR
jgi:CDP-diacylglycerol--glycerol-3-phosphate 3-phosphatidyltransferase